MGKLTHTLCAILCRQVIINLPPHIQILAMSATVRNPEDLGGWIGQVGAAACREALLGRVWQRAGGRRP